MRFLGQLVLLAAGFIGGCFASILAITFLEKNFTAFVRSIFGYCQGLGCIHPFYTVVMPIAGLVGLFITLYLMNRQ